MKEKHWQVSVFEKTSEPVKNDTFYTTDTEAYLVFELIDEDFIPDSAMVTVYNIYGKATINANVEVADGIVRYEIPEEAIGHPGGWRTQVIFTKDNEDYTTKIIEFDIGGHLLDNKKPAIVDIENWNSFIEHAGELIDDWEQLEEIRQANEQQRESAESARQTTFETNESTRQSEFETNETSRQTNELVREEAENNRQSTFETNETERQNEFETNETERENTFEISESARQENELIREEAEGNRQSTFEEKEAGRQSEFEENEQARESAESERVANEEGRETAESKREVAETDRNAKVAELSEEIADMKNEGILTYTIEVANKCYYNPDIEIDTDLNTITIPNHEFVEGESISFHSDVLPNSNLPKGIVEGKLYTVKDMNNDTFSLNEVTLTSDGANDLDRAWFVSTSVSRVLSPYLNLHSGHVRIIGRVWLAHNEMAKVSLNSTADVLLTNSGKYVEFDFIAKIDDGFNERVRVTGVAMSETDSRLLDGIIRGGNLGYYGDKNIYAVSIASGGNNTRIAGNSYMEVYDLG